MSTGTGRSPGWMGGGCGVRERTAGIFELLVITGAEMSVADRPTVSSERVIAAAQQGARFRCDREITA